MIISRLGFDHYLFSQSELLLLRSCRKEKIACFDVRKDNDGTIAAFYIYERKHIKKIFPNATFLYTSGVLGMLMRNIEKKERIISYLCVILLWILLSMCVFRIDVYGESDSFDYLIQNALKDDQYHISNATEIKKKLLRLFKKDISWIEVYEKGNVIKIRYTLKKNIATKPIVNAPLIAKKDGMIAYFQCANGFKLKKVNDLVKKGDVLVDSSMQDSFGHLKSVKVEGCVFAYTWEKVVIEIKNNHLPDAINYWQMILMARDELLLEYEKGEKIVKENVLHFTKKQDKISLTVIYTLLEDITT